MNVRLKTIEGQEGELLLLNSKSYGVTVLRFSKN